MARPVDAVIAQARSFLGERMTTNAALREQHSHGEDTQPRVLPDASFTAMLREMTGKGLGFTAIAEADGRVLGIFTDGDLRRLIERAADLRALRASDVMHKAPRLVAADALAVDAADLMELHRITSVLVVDARGLLAGALNSNDLMRAKVI